MSASHRRSAPLALLLWALPLAPSATTGCGGESSSDDGAPLVASGLASSAPLASLDATERAQLCDALLEASATLDTTERSCTMLARMESTDMEDVRDEALCEQRYEACLQDPPETRGTITCLLEQPVSEACVATVGELEQCINDVLETSYARAEATSCTKDPPSTLSAGEPASCTAAAKRCPDMKPGSQATDGAGAGDPPSTLPAPCDGAGQEPVSQSVTGGGSEPCAYLAAWYRCEVQATYEIDCRELDPGSEELSCNCRLDGREINAFMDSGSCDAIDLASAADLCGFPLPAGV